MEDETVGEAEIKTFGAALERVMEAANQRMIDFLSKTDHALARAMKMGAGGSPKPRAGMMGAARVGPGADGAGLLLIDDSSGPVGGGTAPSGPSGPPPADASAFRSGVLRASADLVLRAADVDDLNLEAVHAKVRGAGAGLCAAVADKADTPSWRSHTSLFMDMWTLNPPPSPPCAFTFPSSSSSCARQGREDGGPPHPRPPPRRHSPVAQRKRRHPSPSAGRGLGRPGTLRPTNAVQLVNLE